MSTYIYNVAPKTGGGFTTRVVLGSQIVEADLTAAIATAAGVTAPQADAVIRGLLTRLLTAAADCNWSSGLYDTISVRPTSGGSETAPDDFHTPDDLAANVQLTFSAEQIRTWRTSLSLERVGEVGTLTPVIDTILSEENGAVDHYVAGTLIRLRGDHLKFKKTDTAQGVFFQPATGAEVRATIYGIIDPSQVTVLVPGTLSGPLDVRIAAGIGSSLRSFTYTHPIS